MESKWPAAPAGAVVALASTRMFGRLKSNRFIVVRLSVPITMLPTPAGSA